MVGTVAVLLLVLSVSLVSCGGGDGGIPILPGTRTLTVRVVNEENHNAAAANAAVVLGDSTGAMVTWATTDADGLVTFFNPPENATVTAMTKAVPVPWDPLKWQYSLAAAYDVNVSNITLSLSIMEKIGEAMVNVTVDAGFPSVNHWHINPGWGWGMSNPSTILVYKRSLQKDGLISFVVIGEDAGNNPVAFGKLLNQTFDPATTPTYNVTIDTAFTEFTTTVSNAAASADFLYSSLDMNEQNSYAISAEKTFGPAETTLAVPAVSIPGYGDSFTHTVAAGKDVYKGQYGDVYDGFATWLYGISRMTTTALTSPQAVDLDPALYPSIPEGLWITGTGTARPMLSWSGSDSSADFREIEINFDTMTGQYRYKLLLPATRENVTFPELPTDVVSDWFYFQPFWLSRFGLGTGSIDNSIIAGYNDYLRKQDRIASGAMAMPDDVTVKMSRAEKNFNAVIKGEYEISKYEIFGGANSEPYITSTSRMYATFTGDGMMNYQVLEDSFNPSPPPDLFSRTCVVSAYNLLTFPDGNGMEAGAFLPNHGIFVITDASEARFNSFQVGVRKSDSIPSFSGEYVMSRIGENAGGPYTSRVRFISNGDGTGTWEIVSHSQGATGSGTFEYTLSLDGTLGPVDMYDGVGGFIGTDRGMVASDGNAVVLVDASSEDGDGDIMLGVGIKKTAAAPVPFFSPYDRFHMNFIGAGSGGAFASRLNVIWDIVNTEFDCTVLADSRGIAPGTQFTVQVTRSATDNTFLVESGDHGVLSPDGQFFAVVDTKAADGEIKLAVGVRY
jgi:hypothetical protein